MSAKVYFFFLSGAKKGRIEPAGADGPIRIGRQHDCGLQLDPYEDLPASGYHAQVVPMADGTFELEDAGSSWGTYKNDIRIMGRVPVTTGDVILCGRDDAGKEGPRIKFYLEKDVLRCPACDGPVYKRHFKCPGCKKKFCLRCIDFKTKTCKPCGERGATAPAGGPGFDLVEDDDVEAARPARVVVSGQDAARVKAALAQQKRPAAPARPAGRPPADPGVVAEAADLETPFCAVCCDFATPPTFTCPACRQTFCTTHKQGVVCQPCAGVPAGGAPPPGGGSEPELAVPDLDGVVAEPVKPRARPPSGRPAEGREGLEASRARKAAPAAPSGERPTLEGSRGPRRPPAPPPDAPGRLLSPDELIVPDDEDDLPRPRGRAGPPPATTRLPAGPDEVVVARPDPQGAPRAEPARPSGSRAPAAPWAGPPAAQAPWATPTAPPPAPLPAPPLPAPPPAPPLPGAPPAPAPGGPPGRPDPLFGNKIQARRPASIPCERCQAPLTASSFFVCERCRARLCGGHRGSAPSLCDRCAPRPAGAPSPGHPASPLAASLPATGHPAAGHPAAGHSSQPGPGRPVPRPPATPPAGQPGRPPARPHQDLVETVDDTKPSPFSAPDPVGLSGARPPGPPLEAAVRFECPYCDSTVPADAHRCGRCGREL